MLRRVVLTISVGLFAAAVIAFVLRREAIGLLAFASVLLVGTALERVGYGRAAMPPSPDRGWRSTDERFVDPATGRLVTVWFHAASGARRYVDEGPAPPVD